MQAPWLVLAKLAAILGAQLICAGGTGQGAVGAFPEPLRVEEDENLPYKPGDEGQAQETPAIHAGEEDQRGEHHQMIPVEDAAGGAAAILHHQAPGDCGRRTLLDRNTTVILLWPAGGLGDV